MHNNIDGDEKIDVELLLTCGATTVVYCADVRAF